MSIRVCVVAAVLMGGWSLCVAHGAVENVWIGSGDADDGAKWSLGVIPDEGHIVKLSGDNNEGLVWNSNMNFRVAGWVQDSTYTKTVSVHTTKGTLYSNLVVTGNAVLNGGRWQHDRGDLTEAVDNPIGLFLEVGGDLTAGSAFVFDARGLGWGPKLGPSGDSTVYGGIGHGGYGGGSSGTKSLNPNSKCYGDYLVPNTLGSSAQANIDKFEGSGGGLLNIQVAGTFTLEGTVTAEGAGGSSYCSGPGGSIYIKAAALLGETTARISANAGGQSGARGSGGGGRIAIYTQDESYEAFTNAFRGIVSAWSTKTSASKTGDGNVFGGPGTIYVETAGADNRIMRLNNNGLVAAGVVKDELRSTQILVAQPWMLDRLILEKNARVQLLAGATLSLPSGAAIVSDGAVNNLVRLEAGTVELADEERPMDARTFSLRMSKANVLPCPLILGAGRALTFADTASSLSVKWFKYGERGLPRGTYTATQLNEWAGAEIAGTVEGRLITEEQAPVQTILYLN